MSGQFDKLRSNKYFCLFVVVFFIVFLIVEYNQGDEIETEADAIIDFSEGNPFGTF